MKIMNKIKADKAALRRFGLTMSVSFAVITLVIFLKKGEVTVIAPAISLILLIAALISPIILSYVYIFWMKLAFLLGWLNTRLLLCIIFYAVFAPVGLILRLFRVDPLERRLDEGISSYWKPKEDKRFMAVDYERQF